MSTVLPHSSPTDHTATHVAAGQGTMEQMIEIHEAELQTQTIPNDRTRLTTTRTFSSSSTVHLPDAPLAQETIASSSSSLTALPLAALSSSRSSSVFGSMFQPKHHRRGSSNVVGWDSDDDEELDRATARTEPATLPPISEKSIWLQKEHGKQKQVRTCLCLGVILCFLILGTILAFAFKEQLFHHQDDSYSAIGRKHPTHGPGPQGGHGGGDPRKQLHDSIESLYHVNRTIQKNPDLSRVLYGIDYTPHGSQEPDCKANLGQVIEDIKILSQLTNRIRLYGMACRQAEYVLKAIEYLGLPDMQVILTLWVDNNQASWKKQSAIFWNIIDNDMLMDADSHNNDDGNDEDMLKEQMRKPKAQGGLISISRVASRIIGVSVGNEVLFRNEDSSRKQDHVPLSTLTGYMDEIRAGLAERATAASSGDASLTAKGRLLSQIPIFSSDLGRNAHQIVGQVDWVLSNIHPFFAYTSVDQATDWAIANYRTETLQAAGDKPAMISEVGWPSGPASAKLGSAVPSMANLQTFIDTWVCKANKLNIPYYYFEAFDEPWKNTINAREAQWGLLTFDRKLKIRLPVC